MRTGDPDKFATDLKCRTRVDSDVETLMLHYRNAFENTGDSQKAAEALFASKIILVEGESESLILPFCFDQIGYDYVGKGISIVRCGGKNELDRFYRFYSEFGIPCYILFDGDLQNADTPDAGHTIKANRAILTLFGEEGDFPDGYIHDNYLGFTRRLEEGLRIGEIGSGIKGVRLFVKFKEALQEGASIPAWVEKISNKIDALPDEAASILKS